MTPKNTNKIKKIKILMQVLDAGVLNEEDTAKIKERIAVLSRDL